MDPTQTPPTTGAAPVATASPKRKPRGVSEIYLPQRNRDPHAPIYIASFPPIIYFWPSVLICYIAAAVQGAIGTPSGGVGWLFVSIVALNFIVLVHDFDQKQFIIFILALVVFWLGVWIMNLYGFTFLRSIAAWILSSEPVLSTDAYLLLGTLLGALYIWGLIAPLFSYWQLEQNEFVHYSQPAGRDMSIARANCSIYKEIPDIFECLLSGGGGTLVIRRNEQVLATIPHVPFLGMRMDAIEHLLAETRVVIERSEV